MTVTVTHGFVVNIADDPTAAAAGEVLPSHWNANHTVTGASTGPPFALVNIIAPPTTGDIPSGEWNAFKNTNTDATFIALNDVGTVKNLTRWVLTGNITFTIATPVNGGSDSNDGSVAHPWATLQHSMDFISANIDAAGFTITINIGTGTFAGVGLKSPSGGGFIQFNGNGQTLTIIGAGPNDGVFNFGECIGNYPQSTGVEMFMDNVKLAPTILSAYGAGNNITFNFGTLVGFATAGVTVDLTNWAAGAVPIFNNDGGAFLPVLGSGTLTIVGAGKTVDSVFQSRFDLVTTLFFGGAVAVTGSLTTVTGYTVCLANGVFQVSGSTFTGAGVTGPRFSSTANSSIQSTAGPGSMGPNFFPGNSSGVVDGSASYDGFFGVTSGAGLPTTTQFPDPGTGGLYKDTGGGGVYSVYNDGGTIKKVALT